MYADVVRVEAEQMPVRVAPGASSASMLGFAEGQPIGEVSLNRGDYVSVLMGPLPLGGDTWYLVWPAEGGQAGYSLTSWRPAGTDGGTNPGWVMASKAGDQRFTLFHRPTADEVLAWGPMLVAADDANYLSPPQPRHDLFSLNWAAAVRDVECPISIRLIPDGGPEPILAVETSTDVVAQGSLTGTETIHAPWVLEDDSWSTFHVEVASGCSWTFALTPLGHD